MHNANKRFCIAISVYRDCISSSNRFYICCHDLCLLPIKKCLSFFMYLCYTTLWIGSGDLQDFRLCPAVASRLCSQRIRLLSQTGYICRLRIPYSHKPRDNPLTWCHLLSIDFKIGKGEKVVRLCCPCFILWVHYTLISGVCLLTYCTNIHLFYVYIIHLFQVDICTIALYLRYKTCYVIKLIY